MSRMNRGDTIIEVIMAVAVFSMVAIGAIALMNSGIAMAQRSLETTLVRQQIDAQADMLRYVADQARAGDPQFMTLWGDFIKPANMPTAPTSLLNIDECPASTPSSGWFTLHASAGQIKRSTAYQQQPSTYARVNSDPAQGSEGISIQLSKVSNGRAYDAYIQACWYGPGQTRPMTIGTIVRIYDEKA